jgi:very-short-patch-repair endonuclease
MPGTASVVNTRRPFTRADALAAGVSPKQLRGSRFRRIFRGVLIDARVPDGAWVRTAAALMIHPPEAFASHFSAGRLYGVPLPTEPAEHVTVFEADRRAFRVGIKCHATKFAVPDDVAVLQGLRVSTPCRMFVELASVLGLVELVVVGDALIRLGLATRREIVAYCNDSPAHHAGDARRAASYVRDRVESPMETRLRMLLVLSGLPEPEINHEVAEADGVALYRFDLSYPELRLVVEYDGRQHADDPRQWAHDIERREWLDDHGWKLLVVTSAGIYREPVRTVERVRQALAERGCQFPPWAMSQDWRPHFPSYERTKSTIVG